VDLVRDHVAHGGIHGAVAGELVEAGEARGHDEYAVVARAALGTGVTRVAGALVLERDVLRPEPRPQPLEQPILAGHGDTIPQSGRLDSAARSRRCGGMQKSYVLVAALVLAAGCSARRPVLYPNETLHKAGPAGADRDIAECMALADGYVKSGGRGREIARDAAIGGGTGAAAGAVGGAIYGSAGRGAAAGAATGVTAGVLSGLFKSSGPSPVYQNFVNTCLSDRGYRVIGWD